MIRIRRILCPVDFSKASDAAVAYATELARRLGAELSLVHALRVPNLPLTEGMAGVELLAALQKDLERALSEQAERLTGVSADTQVVEGTPHVVIRRMAKDTGADLVVMGTRGRSGLGRLLLGSVAERVVQTSKIPVLTVPPAAGDAPHPVPGGIVVGCDFSDASRRALEWARTLRKGLAAGVRVVSVDDDRIAELPPSVRDRWESAEQRARRLRFTRSELERVVEEVFGPDAQAIVVEVRTGEASAELIRAAVDSEAELLVAGATGKSAVDRMLLGTTTRRLVRRSPVPVLTVE